LKLLRYEDCSGIQRSGFLEDGKIFPLNGLGIVEAMKSLERNSESWNQIVNNGPVQDDALTLLSPVENPGAFLDFYTFEEHVKTCRQKRGLEMVPEWYENPVWYNGSTRNFLGNGGLVKFPKGENKKDFELELAVVLKKKCSSVSPDEAKECIGGFTILNDFSAREIQQKIMPIGLGPAKAKDFCTGLGPYIVTPDEIGDARNLAMKAYVNGELWSEGNSGSSHYFLEEAIAYASEFQTLYPGDVIASGTVGTGCGLELDRFLKTGDEIVLEIENIGRLSHMIC